MPTNRDDAKYQEGNPRGPSDVETGVIVSSDTRRPNRIPPGQSRTRKWPVLHATTVPHISLDRWTLEIRGLVQRPLTLSWNEFRALPRSRVFADFHCVTRWSRLDNLWEGVAVRDVLGMAGLKPEARYVIVGAYDGDWTTNLPLAHFLADDALFADTHDGEPLNSDHGGPCRLIVPRLYAWKSAKWVHSVELKSADQPGYWEQLGYHNQGDPWSEERFSD
jgi:DMSO/TMAO reductase YedYZ molybdopterin-dependent catalytic subunit